MIILKKVNKVYNGLAGKVHALKDVDLLIQQGEKVIITGKSGSGKSTLLNILSGIDRPESGEIIVAGKPLQDLNEGKLAKWRGQHIGIVFQFYQLLPTLSVQDNILFAMELVNVIPRGDRRQRATHLLKQVGLLDKAKKFPNELSGGEAQRVAIARALANNPPIIIADEPTGNLDTVTGEQIYSVFDSLYKEGKTLIIVTHENLSNQKFDRMLHIQDGVVENLNILI